LIRFIDSDSSPKKHLITCLRICEDGYINGESSYRGGDQRKAVRDSKDKGDGF